MKPYFGFGFERCFSAGDQWADGCLHAPKCKRCERCARREAAKRRSLRLTTITNLFESSDMNVRRFMCGWPPPGKRSFGVQRIGRLQSCVRACWCSPGGLLDLMG